MKFLTVTDLHYSDKPTGANNRHHSESADKLAYAVKNHIDGCEFIACLGDIVDAFDGCKSQQEGLEDINAVLSECSLPFYATFGNHDTAMDKNEFIRMTGMPARYYSFETADYLCIMLDSCMNSKDEPYPEEEIIWHECYIDDGQLEWLESELAKAQKPVVVFTHILLTPGDTDEVDHILNNAEEVIGILMKYEEKITAVFCGHYHFGMHARIGMIPCVVFKALCTGEAITCAEVEISGGKVIITGHGDEESCVFER